MTSPTHHLRSQLAFLAPSTFLHSRRSSTYLSRPRNISYRKPPQPYLTFRAYSVSSLLPPPNASDSSTDEPSPTAEPSPSSTPEPLPNRWAVVSAASLIHALHAACVYLGPTVLMSPMRHSLNLSIAQITQPLTAFRIIQAVFLVPSGYLLDKVGAQICLRVSLTTAALLTPLLPLASTLPQLVLLQSLFGLTKLFGGLSAMLVIAAQAFPDGKGLATATSVLLSGYSLAGFIAPTFIGALADSLGWRFAFLILSVIFALVALPLTFHFLRDRDTTRSCPTIPGLLRSILRSVTTINSNQSSAQYTTASDSQQGWEQKKIEKTPSNYDRTGKRSNSIGKVDVSDPPEPLLTRPYLLVVTAVASFSFPMHIVFDHLIVFLGEDFGLPFRAATKYMSALNLVALFGKLGAGPIADRYSKSLLMSMFALMAATACALLLDFSGLGFVVTASHVKVKVFVALFAIGYAAVFTLTTAILPELGKKRLGLRSSFNFMVLYAAGSLGSWLAALFRSHTGTYKWAFLSSVLAWIIVAIAGIAYYVIIEKNRNVGKDSNLGESTEATRSKPILSHPTYHPDG